MPDVTIVYWRDIPAQVIVGKGRRYPNPDHTIFRYYAVE